MSSSSSLDTASGLSSLDSIQEPSFDDGMNDGSISPEIASIYKNQNREIQRFQKDVVRSSRNAKKWAKTQVDTVTAIKEAEIEQHRYNLERLQNEYEAALDVKEFQNDEEIREIQTECGELRVEIQNLEFELSEVKEQRKRNLLAVRSEIAAQIKNMEAKEIDHETQISQLKAVLDDLVIKHQNDLRAQYESDAADEEIVDTEIKRVTDSIDRYRQEIFKCDDIQSRRMAEAASTIEMLKSEISASQERTVGIRSEVESTQKNLMKLQQELYKADEQSRVLKEQIAYMDEQKKLMRNELSKLDRALWNNRKTVLLKND